MNLPSRLPINNLVRGTSMRRELAARPAYLERSLWVACSDHQLDHVLEPVLEESSVILVRQPGMPDLFRQDVALDGLSLLDCALQRWRVRTVVLCGHSMCSAVTAPAASGAGASSSPEPRGLWHRSRQREVRNRAAREHLIRQLREVERYPAAAWAIACGQLEVHGLFYVRESDLLTCYEPACGKFVALGT